jgi:hypothetical protein
VSSRRGRTCRRTSGRASWRWWRWRRGRERQAHFPRRAGENDPLAVHCFRPPSHWERYEPPGVVAGRVGRVRRHAARVGPRSHPAARVVRVGGQVPHRVGGLLRLAGPVGYRRGVALRIRGLHHPPCSVVGVRAGQARGYEPVRAFRFADGFPDSGGMHGVKPKSGRDPEFSRDAERSEGRTRPAPRRGYTLAETPRLSVTLV